MLDYYVVLEAYEDLCLGKRAALQLPDNSSDGPKESNPKRTKKLLVPREKEQVVLAVMRYAITRRLGWSKEDAYRHLNVNIMKQLKFDNLMQYINLPADVDWKSDPAFIVAKAFGEKFDYERQVMNVYERILKGYEDKFPKNMFREASTSKFKCAVLLRKFISENIFFRSIPELYARFADTPKINTMLKDARIKNVVDKLYDTPLDCLHDALNDEERDPFMYSYYSFDRVYWMAEKEVKKKKSKKAGGKTAAGS